MTRTGYRAVWLNGGGRTRGVSYDFSANGVQIGDGDTYPYTAQAYEYIVAIGTTGGSPWTNWTVGRTVSTNFYGVNINNKVTQTSNSKEHYGIFNFLEVGGDYLGGYVYGDFTWVTNERTDDGTPQPNLQMWGGYFLASADSPANACIGVEGGAYIGNANGTQSFIGVRGMAMAGYSDVAKATAGEFEIRTSAPGDPSLVTQARGVHVIAKARSLNQATHLKGLALDSWTYDPTSVVDNVYGIYADTTLDFSGVTNKWFIYSLSTNPSMFKGDLWLNSELAGRNYFTGAKANLVIYPEDVAWGFSHDPGAVNWSAIYIAQYNASASASKSTKGIELYSIYQGSGANNNIYGADIRATSNTTQVVNGLIGAQIWARAGNSGTVGLNYGVSVDVGNAAGGQINSNVRGVNSNLRAYQGTITEARIFNGATSISGGGGGGATVTTLKGLNLGFGDLANVTNSYGIYLESTIDKGTALKYAIYSLSTSPSILSGNLTVDGTGKFFITTPETPATAAAAGTTGQVAWDTNYIYVCVAANTWKRTALSTW